jgi:hypothetical protein
LAAPATPGHDRNMSEASSGPVGARVVASAPLLQAGLERAARAAGLRVAGGEEMATIGIRSPNAGPTHTAVDVCADATQVTITLAAVPDPETWSRLLALLHQLVDHGS